MTTQPVKINWPDGVDQTSFLDQYWQRQPLLIRQAFPEFDSPIEPDDLAYFATVPDTTPRLILAEKNGYTVEHGPFEDDRFEHLTKNNWSLLVSDVEKHWPEFSIYLTPFHFLPTWRMDDLMVSYAPNGASVGAHVDAYDVFLMQASGTREWQIDTDASKRYNTNAVGDLAHIENFMPSDTYILEPGDMLYLPPGIAHHGISRSDDCTSWSIGFRAPSQADVLEEFSNVLLETIGQTRIQDQASNASISGEINQASLTAIIEIWTSAISVQPRELQRLAGLLITQPHPQLEVQLTPTPLNFDETTTWMRNPFSRFAFIRDSDKATLFVDGQDYPCSFECARALCTPGLNITAQEISAMDIDQRANDERVFSALIEIGALVDVASR